MNCELFENLWIDYFDESLDAASKQQVEEHLQQCGRCSALVAEMRANLVLANAIPEVEPPPRLIHKILKETSGEPAGPAWYDFIFDFIRPQQLPRLAMGSLMAVASLAVVLYATGFNFRDFTTADLKPSRLWEKTNREVHLAFSRGVKYYNALRIVYEIQSRIETFSGSSSDQDQTAPADQQPSRTPTPTKPGSQRISEDRSNTLYLVQNLGCPMKPGGLS